MGWSVSDPTEPTLEELEAACTDKERMLVIEYLTCWNGTEAAKRAKYAGSYETLRVVASETLRKPHVRALIEWHIKQKAMSADEVLARLAEMARGSMADFISVNGRVKLDFRRAQDAGKLHLIKSYTKGPKGTRIELYDAQAALVQLGKAMGLFTERLDVTSGGEPIKGNDGHDRAISALADALREIVSGAVAGEGNPVDAAEQTTVVSTTEPGG